MTTGEKVSKVVLAFLPLFALMAALLLAGVVMGEREPETRECIEVPAGGTDAGVGGAGE